MLQIVQPDHLGGDQIFHASYNWLWFTFFLTSRSNTAFIFK